MLKYIKFVVFILLFFISKESFSVKTIEQLNSYEQLIGFIQKNNIDLQKTLFVLDIDNTLVREFPEFMNQDFSRGSEQHDQVEEIAAQIGIHEEHFLEAHAFYRKKGIIFYDLIEPCLPGVIQDLQQQGAYVMTCTNSTFPEDRLDQRVKMLRASGINLSNNFIDKDLNYIKLPFFKSKLKKGHAYIGHTSSRKTSKIYEINKMFSSLNCILAESQKPLLEHVVFIDNTFTKVTEVYSNVTAPNVYALHYTYVRDNINIEEIEMDYKVCRTNFPNTFSFDIDLE
ncbi:MAG: DUF2608 domain-containing protein [Alphaproteobacteria bacterium]|nr:DUF2608 domain-containing protein [Alphaproteobacteria bacterium]